VQGLIKNLKLESQYLQSYDCLFSKFGLKIEEDTHNFADIETRAQNINSNLYMSKSTMQFFETIFLDSAVFIEKKWWGMDGGEKLKFGGVKNTSWAGRYVVVVACSGGCAVASRARV
jgi:hypothetical protein